jgi:hypothetical protein
MTSLNPAVAAPFSPGDRVIIVWPSFSSKNDTYSGTVISLNLEMTVAKIKFDGYAKKTKVSLEYVSMDRSAERSTPIQNDHRNSASTSGSARKAKRSLPQSKVAPKKKTKRLSLGSNLNRLVQAKAKAIKAKVSKMDVSMALDVKPNFSVDEVDGFKVRGFICFNEDGTAHV